MFAIAALFSAGVVVAQDSASDDVFYFDFMEDKLDESSVDMSIVGKHYLGDGIAKKLQLLQESYTWEEAGTPSSPGTKTIVEKPSIYYALKKLSSGYKKKVKKGEMSEEEALDELTKALDIGLFIRYQNTEEFEAKLKELKSPEEIAYLFTKKVQLQY